MEACKVRLMAVTYFTIGDCDEVILQISDEIASEEPKSKICLVSRTGMPTVLKDL